MPVTCVFGAQWGDEGKGKVVDYLAKDADLVVRYQGGANAGHTIRIGAERFALRLTPSGVLQGALGVIANGVAVDPKVLLDEIDLLEAKGIPARARVVVSDRAHLVLPFHAELDRALDASRPEAWRVDTTGRGVSTAIADKHLYDGFRVADLLNPRVRRDRLPYLLERGNRRLAAIGAAAIDVAAACRDAETWAERLAPLARETVGLLLDAVEAGKRIVLEGAQAALLDVDFGTYPFCTTSNTGVAAACAGTGLPPRAVDRVLAVAKAYTTRVGRGPFPTEDEGAVGAGLRERGHEYGTVTGRARRCGWFDAVAMRHVCRLNGVDSVALTKIDVLGGVDPLRVCVAYRVDGKTLDAFPSDIDVLRRCEPVYEEIPGFFDPIQHARSPHELPPRAQAYVRALETRIGAKVGLLSVGPERNETVPLGAR